MIFTLYYMRNQCHSKLLSRSVKVSSFWTSSLIVFSFDGICMCSVVLADPCLVQYCSKGRECHVVDGVARCVCQRECRNVRSIVCGSDGKLYDNHCQLHRTACLTNTHIAVDHYFTCLAQGNVIVSGLHTVRYCPNLCFIAVLSISFSIRSFLLQLPRYLFF